MPTPNSTNSKVIKGITPSLRWLTDLLAFFQTESITVPKKYRERVLCVKQHFEDDTSGLVNTMLDCAISSALVNYKVETKNKNLSEILNKWLLNINSDLRGKVPTGLEALAKEYFRERWKGSSNLVLRTFWSENDDLTLPTSLFFVDGEDIKVKSKTDDGVVILGDEQYYIKVGDPLNSKSTITKDDIKLPKLENELIFVQKPFESWGTLEPVPFLIRRGIYRNSEFLKLMSSKGEFIISKALEYLLIMKKGTERLALDGQITYDENDLKQANEDLKNLVLRKKNEAGFPSYTTNFDTDIQEYIPEYSKVINDTIYSPIEKRILAGLGLIEVVEGVASTRREGILNPKPFITEINQGVKDFKAMLNDIVQTIIEKNSSQHKKWMSTNFTITSTPVKTFMDDKIKTGLRSLYDRGLLSKRTLVEVVGDVDFDLEVERRIKETEEKLDDKLYPPVTQNMEDKGEDFPGDKKTDINPSPKKKTLPDRTGPEAKNFKQASKEE